MAPPRWSHGGRFHQCPATPVAASVPGRLTLSLARAPVSLPSSPIKRRRPRGLPIPGRGAVQALRRRHGHRAPLIARPPPQGPAEQAGPGGDELPERSGVRVQRRLIQARRQGRNLRGLVNLRKTVITKTVISESLHSILPRFPFCRFSKRRTRRTPSDVAGLYMYTVYRRFCPRSFFLLMTHQSGPDCDFFPDWHWPQNEDIFSMQY